MSGKQVCYTGVNKNGNVYTAYTDGSYTYKNWNSGNLTTLNIIVIAR